MVDDSGDQLGMFLLLCVCILTTAVQFGMGLAFFLSGYQVLTIFWMVVVWFSGWTTAALARWYIELYHSDNL